MLQALVSRTWCRSSDLSLYWPTLHSTGAATAFALCALRVMKPLRSPSNLALPEASLALFITTRRCCLRFPSKRSGAIASDLLPVSQAASDTKHRRRTHGICERRSFLRFLALLSRYHGHERNVYRTSDDWDECSPLLSTLYIFFFEDTTTQHTELRPLCDQATASHDSAVEAPARHSFENPPHRLKLVSTNLARKSEKLLRSLQV